MKKNKNELHKEKRIIFNFNYTNWDNFKKERERK